MGPRAGLEGCGNSRTPPAFDPRPVQPVASPINIRGPNIFVNVQCYLYNTHQIQKLHFFAECDCALYILHVRE